MSTSQAKLIPLSPLAGDARPRKVAVVIPAHNEEENIVEVLEGVAALRGAHPEWEILPVVVNDASTDHTAEVLESEAAHLGAWVIHLPINLGIGGAVQTGFRFAMEWGADVTLQLDGDGQHPPEQIPSIVEPVLAGRADIVVGSRYVDGGGGMVSSVFRRAGTRFFSWLLWGLVRARVADATSGFRAFGPEAADFISRWYPDDYPEVQSYVPLARLGFSVLEVPATMRWRRAGVSSITPIRSVYYMVKVALASVVDMLRELPRRRPAPAPRADLAARVSALTRRRLDEASDEGRRKAG